MSCGSRKSSGNLLVAADALRNAAVYTTAHTLGHPLPQVLGLTLVVTLHNSYNLSHETMGSMRLEDKRPVNHENGRSIASQQRARHAIRFVATGN